MSIIQVLVKRPSYTRKLLNGSLEPQWGLPLSRYSQSFPTKHPLWEHSTGEDGLADCEWPLEGVSDHQRTRDATGAASWKMLSRCF